MGFQLSGILLYFQVSAHWILLAEARWCLEQFGETCRRYMERAHRYIEQKKRGTA